MLYRDTDAEPIISFGKLPGTHHVSRTQPLFYAFFAQRANVPQRKKLRMKSEAFPGIEPD